MVYYIYGLYTDYLKVCFKILGYRLSDLKAQVDFPVWAVRGGIMVLEVHMWEELGISAGTALVVLIALYFIVKWAVKNGVKEALEEREQEQKKQDSEEDSIL